MTIYSFADALASRKEQAQRASAQSQELKLRKDRYTMTTGMNTLFNLRVQFEQRFGSRWDGLPPTEVPVLSSAQEEALQNMCLLLPRHSVLYVVETLRKPDLGSNDETVWYLLDVRYLNKSEDWQLRTMADRFLLAHILCRPVTPEDDAFRFALYGLGAHIYRMYGKRMFDTRYAALGKNFLALSNAVQQVCAQMRV